MKARTGYGCKNRKRNGRIFFNKDNLFGKGMPDDVDEAPAIHSIRISMIVFCSTDADRFFLFFPAAIVCRDAKDCHKEEPQSRKEPP